MSGVEVQCGECYCTYIIHEGEEAECPFCGSDEIVGMR